MLNLLFIEDEIDSLRPVLKLIENEHTDMNYQVASFADAEDTILSYYPDIIILDLLIGGASPEPDTAGLRTREFIWKNHFCPIVIYSAAPEIHDDLHEEHPYIKSVKKGRDSSQEVLQVLDELRPYIEAIQEANKYLKQSFSLVLRDIAPYAFKTFTDNETRKEIIKRSGRRRLAAMMDGLSNDKTKLASWEQYLYPPVCEDIQLGDILRKADGETTDPSSFRLVLTPSCDLVASNGRKPKVNYVLVARCCAIDFALQLIQLKPGRRKLKDEKEMITYKEQLTKGVLTQGYHKAIIPLPCLEGRIPLMAANLRDLEFILVNNIDLAAKEFLRIASIDSPFRELVSWAYQQIACRPGLPDRDCDNWCDEIIALFQ